MPSDKMDYAKQAARRIKNDLCDEGVQWHWGTVGPRNLSRFNEPTEDELAKLEYLILQWIEAREKIDTTGVNRHVRSNG